MKNHFLLATIITATLGSGCVTPPPGAPIKNFRVPDQELTTLLGVQNDVDSLISQIVATRATIPATEQSGSAYDLMTFVTGSATPATVTVGASGAVSVGTAGGLSQGLSNMALAGGDIEALAFIVLMQATNDVDSDLKAIMAQVKAETAAKSHLRDLISSLHTLSSVTGAPALARAFVNGERVLSNPHVFESHWNLYVPGSGSGSALFDADQGGVVSATITCDYGNTSAYVNASLINLATGSEVATMSADGRANFQITAKLPAGPAPLQLKLEPMNFTGAQIVPCQVVFSRDSRKSVIVRGWDPVKKRSMLDNVAVLNSTLGNLQAEAERLLKAQQLGTEDQQFLLTVIARNCGAINKLGPILSAGAVDAVSAETQDSKDDLNSMSESEQIALQIQMDRRSKVFQTISNLMKKASDTENQLIENMK